jgi:superfamily II DNA or RNA helicase
VSRPAAALFLKPGLGKTVIILAVYHMLRKRGLVKKLLVVSNRRIIYNVWRQEIEKWNLPYTVSLVHGGYRSKRTGKTKKEAALEKDADIYLINFEAIPWLQTKARDVAKFAGGMLALDESIKVKTWMSQRTQAMKRLLPLFKRRYILTGNPTPKSLMDLFAQMYMLDMGKALGSGITKYRNKYFYQYGEKEHGLYALLEGAEKKIYKAISKLAIYFGEDELDLPPMVEVQRYVELDPKARDVYNGIEQNFIAQLKTGVITAANAGVASGKLRQIAGGAVYLPYKTKKLEVKKPKRGKFEVVHDEKVAEVQQIIEELKGRPVFISYEFDHQRLALQKVFKNAPAIFSDTSDTAGAKYIQQWNRGELPVLIGQSQSVSHGLNLQEVEAAVIYFSLSWDFDAFDQFRRRIWRQGQTKPVFVYYILCEDSLDETMFNVLKLKNASQNKLFKALHERYINPDQKELFKMATTKAKGRKVSKATRKKASPAAKKKTSAKRANVKKKPAKKTAVKKRAPRKRVEKPRTDGLKKGAHNPKLHRNADGLRKGTVQATLVAMARRKSGVTVAQLIDKTGSTVNSIRVNVSLLKKRGFALTIERGAYKLRDAA